MAFNCPHCGMLVSNQTPYERHIGACATEIARQNKRPEDRRSGKDRRRGRKDRRK